MKKQSVSFVPIFNRKWLQVYQQLKGTTEHFGVIQQIEHRRVGKYIVFKNKEYFKKRSTNSIESAFRSKKINIQFNEKEFNFKKIHLSQYLFEVSEKTGQLQMILPLNTIQLGSNYLVINSCPLTVNHSLFVPSLSECLPQILNQSILSALLSLACWLPEYKMAFNSQGAGSTVNHFHAQLMQLSHILPNNRFYFEDFPSKQLIHYHQQNITISSFVENNALYFRIHSQQSHLSTQKYFITKSIMKIIDLLLKYSIPHNIIIPGPLTLYIIGRNFATPQRKYGWLEFSGLFIASSPEQYAQTQEYFSNSFTKLSGIDLISLQQKIREEFLGQND